METTNAACAGKQACQAQQDEAFEAQADRMLTESLATMGRGEYPFYSSSYLRRLSQADERATLADEALHPEPGLPACAIIWRLGRKARLNSTEMDILRLTCAGENASASARILCISATRAARLLRRAVEKMRAHVGEMETAVDEQIAWVFCQEQRVDGYRREKHCKPGQELCRKTGLCPRRWYLYESPDNGQ